MNNGQTDKIYPPESPATPNRYAIKYPLALAGKKRWLSTVPGWPLR